MERERAERSNLLVQEDCFAEAVSKIRFLAAYTVIWPIITNLAVRKCDHTALIEDATATLGAIVHNLAVTDRERARCVVVDPTTVGGRTIRCD